MIPADETFDGTWPYEPRFFEGNGFRQHYIDERGGDEGADDVIVCLHGNRRGVIFTGTSFPGCASWGASSRRTTWALAKAKPLKTGLLHSRT